MDKQAVWDFLQRNWNKWKINTIQAAILLAKIFDNEIKLKKSSHKALYICLEK